MATSDYGSLSRGSPDSLQGYIEDDYDCCTLLSAGTDTNDNEVERLQKEIKNLKSIIGELIETNQDISNEKSNHTSNSRKAVSSKELFIAAKKLLQDITDPMPSTVVGCI